MRMKVDSDSDDISDNEIPVHITNILTRSVFNITLDLPGEETRENNEITQYEERLNSEIEEWLSLLKETRKTSSAASSISNADLTVLSPQKQAYLNKAPDLNKLVEESIKFRREAKVYLEEDYADVLQLHENLTELCNDVLDTKKSVLVEEYIFNNGRPRRQK